MTGENDPIPPVVGSAEPRRIGLAPRKPPAARAETSLLAEPTFEECHTEYVRYQDDRAAGRIALRDIPEGEYVAYYAGHIVDHSSDPTALRTQVAATLGVHPARVVVDYPWAW